MSLFLLMPFLLFLHQPFMVHVKSNFVPLQLLPQPYFEVHGTDTVIVSSDIKFTFAVAGEVSIPREKPKKVFRILELGVKRFHHYVFSSHSLASYRTPVKYPVIQRVDVEVRAANRELQYETDESYILIIPNNGSNAIIKSETVFGALHALQTFSQLCVFDWSTRLVLVNVAPVEIADTPRFAHRGVLVDTSRHFQPTIMLKEVIESMTYAKFNVLHWHMVDEQSFPVEVPLYPRLTEGSYGTQERFTLHDARSLVQWAYMRGVRIMPEIDVPGHAESWGVGYPTLWPSEDCRMPLDVSNNFTFQVIDGILSDFSKVFQYGFFHVGGDEVNVSCWENTQHIDKWLAERAMSAKDGYKYFVQRAQELAVSHGWSPVTWEEPFVKFGSSLHPKCVVHNWLALDLIPKIVEAGYRCLASNVGAWYLDILERAWDVFYDYEPLDGVDPSMSHLVMGGEVCMWGETVDASNILPTIWPRAAAAAERLWSPREKADFADKELVEERLQWFRCLLLQRGIPASPLKNYYAGSAPERPGSCFVQK